MIMLFAKLFANQPVTFDLIALRCIIGLKRILFLRLADIGLGALLALRAS